MTFHGIEPRFSDLRALPLERILYLLGHGAGTSPWSGALTEGGGSEATKRRHHGCHRLDAQHGAWQRRLRTTVGLGQRRPARPLFGPRLRPGVADGPPGVP